MKVLCMQKNNNSRTFLLIKSRENIREFRNTGERAAVNFADCVELCLQRGGAN